MSSALLHLIFLCDPLLSIFAISLSRLVDLSLEPTDDEADSDDDTDKIRGPIKPFPSILKYSSPLEYLHSGKGPPIRFRKKEWKRLQPGKWWDDKTVDYALSLWFDRHLVSRHSTSTLHVFASHFYASYQENHDKIPPHLIKKLRLFEYDTLIVPVHDVNHWVSIIFCNPGAATDDSNNMPCIFSLDSLNHSRGKFRDNIWGIFTDEATMRGLKITKEPISCALEVSRFLIQ
ncbi:hypothetical protein M422DRAFT_43202 [Sphaerobolus stellatus SS14]|nr:hypothetical protein M422DRAFT_43202 [Sphaerobolus stellatus SS14]